MFTRVMTTRLIELIKERSEELFPSTRRPDTTTTQHGAWEDITRLINAEFPDCAKTLKQVQCKWKNIRQEVKDDVSYRRRRRRSDITSLNPDNMETLEKLSTRSGSYADDVETAPTSDQLTRLLQSVLCGQNANLTSFEGVEEVADDQQLLEYTNIASSSNSPLADGQVDGVGDVANPNGRNFVHISKQESCDTSSPNVGKSKRKRKRSWDDGEDERRSDAEMRKIRLEQEHLKRDLLREQLASQRRMSEVWENTNRFLSTAVTLMDQFMGGNGKASGTLSATGPVTNGCKFNH